MKRVICGLAVAWWLAVVGGVVAQAPPAPTGRVVSIEVTIAELGPPPAGEQIDLATGDAALVRIGEWEAKGVLAALTRIRLTTLDQQVAMVHFGERVPRVTSRTRTGARAGREDGPGFPAGAFSSAFTLENVGALVNAVPRVDVDGAVLVELQIEKSRVAAAAAAPSDSGPTGDFVPPRVVTISTNSTVRIPPGQATIVGGAQSAGADGASRVIIVVQARVSAPPPQVAAAERSLKVFSLAHASAPEVADVLRGVFGDGRMRIAIDQRTNALIVQAGNEELSAVEALVQRLDVDGGN